jgi:hypothetical protein
MSVELFPHQIEVIEQMTKIEKENDGLGCILAHEMGLGKCHKKDTPIIMYDGTVKMVQDIQVGEKLMGDDSTPRNVLSLARGKEKMYKIKQLNRDDYIVNESHILSLKMTGHKGWCETKNGYKLSWLDREKNGLKSKMFSFETRYGRNRFSNENTTKEMAYKYMMQFRESIDDNDIVDIPLIEYMKLTKSLQYNLKGFAVGVNFPTKDVPFDPYILGLWLGDGSSNGPEITNQDEGILRDLELLNNKHIPLIYKANDRITRLKLLAGLIDSDGFFADGCYEITQKSKLLSDDICFLVRSLGFGISRQECYKYESNTQNKKKHLYYRMRFSGKGIEDIPTLCKRKQASPRIQKKDVLVTSITGLL